MLWDEVIRLASRQEQKFFFDITVGDTERMAKMQPVGGTLGVGGIDVNSGRLGCSADQAVSVQVVTPTGDIVECSDTEDPELFQRVILGYGQFGVITEATLRIRPYTPPRMRYFFCTTLRTAIEDLQLLDRNVASACSSHRWYAIRYETVFGH